MVNLSLTTGFQGVIKRTNLICCVLIRMSLALHPTNLPWRKWFDHYRRPRISRSFHGTHDPISWWWWWWWGLGWGWDHDPHYWALPSAQLSHHRWTLSRVTRPLCAMPPPAVPPAAMPPLDGWVPSCRCRVVGPGGHRRHRHCNLDGWRCQWPTAAWLVGGVGMWALLKTEDPQNHRFQ